MPKKRLPKSMNVSVNVTAEMIAQSRVRDSSHCMVATAIRAARPDATSISVDLQTIRFSIPSKRLRYTYLTPRIAQLELIKYDQGRETEPFEFRLYGAHVTTMYSRVVTTTPQSTKTLRQEQALAKARGFNPSSQAKGTGRGRKPKGEVAERAADHPELLRQQLVPNPNGAVSRRVGGSPPPSTPYARRRAFGLRGIQM